MLFLFDRVSIHILVKKNYLDGEGGARVGGWVTVSGYMKVDVDCSLSLSHPHSQFIRSPSKSTLYAVLTLGLRPNVHHGKTFRRCLDH
jgi:hypothetical protein